MAISASLLDTALKNKCTFSFNRNHISEDDETVIRGEWNVITHDRYRMARTTMTRDEIKMVGTTEDDLQANTVNVVYEDTCATMGSVCSPGLVFSDSFSGCVFHLYRGPMGHVMGVHASRSSGRLADPDGWITARGGKCIYTWDSLRKVTPGNFGAVFAYVDKTSIYIYAVEHKNGKVINIIEEAEVRSWQSATL